MTTLIVSTAVDPSPHEFALDFRGGYLPAAHAVVDGESPYPMRDDWIFGYVYPPLVAVALTPLTFVPEGVAALLFVLASAGLLVASLALLGVRDIRCYAALFMWAPTWNELEMGSVSAGFVLALALAWRFRKRVWPQPLALGLAVSAKLFLWPLLVWTLAIRGVRTTLLAVATALATTTLAWAVIGFDGLLGYPALLRRLTEIYADDSYSLVGISLRLGLSAGASHAVALVAGSALLGGCLAFARRGDEQRSFTLAIVAALAFTSILWQHYLLLLLVPLAVARPRFSMLWLLPTVLWLSPRATYDVSEKVLPLLVAALLVSVILWRPLAPGIALLPRRIHEASSSKWPAPSSRSLRA